MTAREVLQKHEKIHFSRIPVYSGTRDNIKGFVLKNELLMDDIRTNGETQLKNFKIRELRAILDKTRLSIVLEQLLDNREHILLVVDEHGGLEGVVTLEDVVETLIGMEIVDEVDKHVDMRKLAREKWGNRMKTHGIDVNDFANENEPDS
jgi:CBS domain containing-hemolysin-like protein